MHSTKIFAVLLGLAAFTTAVPYGNEQRLKWTPRSLQRMDGGYKSNRDIVKIVDTTDVKLTEQSRNSEVQLTVAVKEKIKIEDKKIKAKNNVRKNHYRNKNKNANTIIIVVTEIIDIRDSNSHNTRYMKHQLLADNGKESDIIVQVTEVVAITISNSNGGYGTKDYHNNLLTASSASSAIANAIETVSPSAPFSATNQTMILPSGAPAPEWQNVDDDPAAIVEDVDILEKLKISLIVDEV